MVAGSAQSAGAALHIDSTIFTSRNFAETRKIIQAEIDVSGNHQIDKTVSVIVSEGRSSRVIAGICEPRCLGDVGEGSVAMVAIEDILAEAGDEKIGPAVVVVVANRGAVSEAGRTDPGLRGYVGECSIVIVVVERAMCHHSLERLFDGGSVGEVDVR